MKPRTLQFQIAALCLGGLAVSTPLALADIIITEVNSNSNGGDFFELYNTGASSVDLTGWKWDDDSLNPALGATFGSISIPAGGVLVVSTEAPGTEAAFKTAWNLGDDVTVVATGGPGLGGDDAVILFDSANNVVTSFNYRSTARTANLITIQPFARPGGAAPLGGHAGPSAGAIFGNGVSAVWDGVSTTSPEYVPAVIGSLYVRSQSGAITSIGSPGTNGLFPVDYIPPTPAVITADTTTVPAGELRMRKISSIPLFGSEISAYDPASKRMFVTSTFGLQVIDASNPFNPQLLSFIEFTTSEIGLNSNDVTSVAVSNGKLAVAVPNATKELPGHVVFLNAADGSFISKVQVGVLPDNLTFTPDGTKVLTADEGEMLAGGLDPAPGSVTIIDVTNFNAPVANVVGFGDFDADKVALKAAGVRIFEASPGVLKDPSIDFEPEYVAVSPDGTKAMVTLQEANAVALLDIATATFTSIVPLGEKDYSPLLADFSDRDGPGNTQLINLATGWPVFGMYMPDAIASFGANGQTYYVIANEGDDRNDFLTETTTVANAGYVLDPTVFPDAAALNADASLGRLTVSNAPGLRGDTDGDGDIDRILSYGGRSISILDSTGTIIWDSGDILDQKIAALGTPFFDDGRSDNKSIEPEGVTIGEVDGRTYAFVSLERARSVAAFDVTNPNAPTFAGLAANATDANPEGITFISKADSPNGQPMIAVNNESTNTLTFYSVAPYTLQLLHLADAEAGLLASQTAPNLAALVDAFDGTYPNTLILSGGDNYIPGPFAAAGTDAALSGIETPAFSNNWVGGAHTRGNNPFAVDIEIHNRLGVEASTVGNHEFDFGTNAFSDAILDTEFPYLSANLIFSGDSGISARYQETVGVGGLEEATSVKKKIVPSCVITKGGQKIGLVGATTQILKGITSAGNVQVKGAPTDNDMVLLASQLQPVIDDLRNQGVNKIILMAHLQQISLEQALAPLLNGVDIILAAGSNTRLGDSDDVAVAFAGHAADFAGNYPIYTAGADGFPTVIVNTDNEFTYLGRLVADFDANGVLIVPNLTANIAVNGAYAATAANVAAAWGVSEVDLPTTAFAPGTKGALVKQITDAVQGVITAKDGTIHGYTDVYFEGERAFVRSEETNLGDITADANLGALRSVIGGTAPIVSLKNGGGIRAAIGSVAIGSGEKLPPLANPAVGKPAGGVSQLDIENSLRFNNRLIAFDTTPTGLKTILEHGVASWPNQGRFPQIGGVAFAWDSSLPASSRILTISLIGEDGLPSAAIYQNGAVVSNAPATIKMVTLNFLANNGDGYPMKANGDNFQYLLADGTLGAVLDEGTNFTQVPQLPGNAIGEQQVLANFLAAKHPTPETAYDVAETAAALDLRVQRTNVRSDTVLPYTAAQVLTLNAFSPGMLAIGRSPSLMLTQPDLASAVGDTRTAGQNDVLSAPGDFNLFTAPSLRLDDSILEFAVDATATMTLQSSGDMIDWVDEAIVPDVQIDLSGDKRFFRFQATTTPAPVE